MISRLGSRLAHGVLAVPVLAGLAGTLAPAFGILPALGGHTPTLAPIAALAAEPGLVQSAAMALWTGLASALLSLAIVFLFVAGWRGSRPFAWLGAVLAPLLAVPHAAAAFALAFAIAPSGLLSRAVSPWLTGWERPPDLLIVNDQAGLALIAGLVIKEAPFLFLVAVAALPTTGADGAARLAASLGYGRMAGFLHLVWPPLYRRIRLPVLAVIAFAVSVVDVAAILGPTTPAPLAVRLVGWMNDPDLAMRFEASAGALLQLALAALAILVWLTLERAGGAARRWLAASGLRMRHDGAMRALALVLAMLSAFIVLTGAVSLAIWALAGLWPFPDLLPSRFTLAGVSDLAPRMAGPIANALIVALLSAAGGLVLSILALIHSDRHPGRPAIPAVILYAPLLVPQAAFLFGLQTLAFSLGVVPGLGVLALVHLVFVLPYVHLALAGPWAGYDRRYEAVAIGLAAGRRRMLVGVKLPMLAPALLAAFAIGFAVSIGLYLPTLLIGAGRVATVTTEAVAAASGGNRRVIGAWALAQAMLPLAGFVIAVLLPAILYRRRRGMRA